jgi:hypothetical protein
MAKPNSLIVGVNLLLMLLLVATTAAAHSNNSASAQVLPGNVITSPNGQFSISVTNTGISIKGPTTKINVGEANMTIDGPTSKIDVTVGGINIQAAGPVKVNGAVVQLNGSCLPVVTQDGVARVAVGGPGATYPVLGLQQAARVRAC